MLDTPLVRRAPNGLTVVLIPRDSGQTAHVALDVGVGSRHESVQDAGLSHVLEHLIFHGGPDHPTVAEVDAAAESMGSAFDASTGRASTRLEHRMDPRHLQASATLLADLVRAPRFSGLESERAVIQEEALDEYDEKGRLVDCEALVRQSLWPNHGLGRSIIGTLPNIERFGLPDLARHHATHYRARNMVLTVSGALSVDALAQAAEPFAALPDGPIPATLPAPAPPTRPQFVLVDDGRSQCDCRLTWWAPGDHDPDAAAFELMMRALDDGLASRLHRTLGNQLGLAYEQWGVWEKYDDVGALEIGAHVSPGKVLRFVEAALDLLQGMVERPPTGDELERARFRAGWAVRTQAERLASLADLHGLPRLGRADPPSPRAWIEAVQAITPEAIAAVGRRVLQHPPVVGVVGPTDKTLRRAIRRAVARRWSAP